MESNFDEPIGSPMPHTQVHTNCNAQAGGVKGGGWVGSKTKKTSKSAEWFWRNNGTRATLGDSENTHQAYASISSVPPRIAR